MNRLIAKAGALIVTVTVFLFALFLMIDFNYGSYAVCLILPIGYIMLAVGFYHERKGENSSASLLGVLFAVVYAVLIMLVYYAQLTAVSFGGLTEQAAELIDFRRGGLIFSYDLLGYGMMALSTFFIGLTVRDRTKKDKILKYMMIIHGFFFFPCLIMPMTGMFASGLSGGETSGSGVMVLVCWCVYFIPIGILSFLHFNKNDD